MQLNGLDSRGLLYLYGIHVAVNVGFHNRKPEFVLDEIDCPDEGGGLSASR